MEKISLSRKAYMWALVLMPMLSLYGIGTLGIDIGTLLVLLCLILSVVYDSKGCIFINPNYSIWYIYLIYIVISIFITKNIGFQGSISEASIILRAVKNILYIFILINSITCEIVEYKYLKKIYLVIARISTYYILFQSVMYYGFKRIIPGYIKYFLISESYGERLQETNFLLYRPTSLFYEPSHYLEFIVIALIICLFDEYILTKKNVYDAVLITIGILMSTSGMGIVSLVIIWGIWIIYRLKKLHSYKIQLRVFVLFACIILGAILFMKTNYATKIVSRLFSSSANTYSATDARTEVYKKIFEGSMFSILFGRGYGNVLDNYFFSSWAFNLWCLGIVGTIIIIIIYLQCFKKGKNIKTRLIVVVNAILCIGTTLFMGKNMLFHFTFILLGTLEEKGCTKKI